MIDELVFEEISCLQNISVGNSTNFVNLTQEYENSILINAPQDVESHLIFLGPVYVDEDVKLEGRFNNMNLDQIVTTNTEQNLTAIYSFNSKSNLEKNLNVEGLVNGINMSLWENNGVKTFQLSQQDIDRDWVINKDLVFMGEVGGNGTINGLNLEQFHQNVVEKRNYKYAIEKNFIVS